MSKTLDREQQFDAQRRARREAPLSPAKEPQEITGDAVSVAVIEPPALEAPQPETAIDPPQPANDAPAQATARAAEAPAIRWSTYLLITILFLPFFAYLLREPLNLNPVIGLWRRSLSPVRERPAAVPSPPGAASAPHKQTLSTRAVPPTLRFSAVGAIHEPKKTAESGLSLLPPTLRLLGVSSPLDLVSTQPFMRWEKTETPVLQPPKQAAQAHSPVASAITDPSQLAAVSSTLRALKLMDTAVANAKRAAASENKKPGD